MGKNNKRKTNKGDRSTPNKVKQKALEETFENLKFEDPYEVRLIFSFKCCTEFVFKLNFFQGRV